MNDKLQGFILGATLTAIVLVSVTSFANGSNSGHYENLKCYFNDLKVTLNDQEVKSDVSPFVYNNRTMLPVRAISEAFGLDVNMNYQTNTVELKSKPSLIEDGAAMNYGNSNGNLANKGVFAKDDNSIYCCYDPWGKESGLYKFDKSLQNKTKLFNYNPEYINVIDGYVYFVTYNGLYKCTTEGKELKCLDDGNCSSLYCVNDALFYTKKHEGFYNIDENYYYEIYAMKNDGKEKMKLCNDYVREAITVNSGWIYYTDISNNKVSLCRMRLDGSMKSTISNNSCKYVNVNDNWIYFSNASDGSRLYKMKTDGTNKTKLIDQECFNINFDSDYIYFYQKVNSNHNLCKLSIKDNKISTIALNNRIETLSCIDNSIYYTEKYEEMRTLYLQVFKNDLDNDKQEKLWEFKTFLLP